MLRLNFCDYSDVYIVVEGTISLTSINNANKKIKR